MPVMQPSRIHVLGSSPIFHPLILEEELEASRKQIDNLKEQLATKDAMFNEQYLVYKTSAEEHDAKMQAWTNEVTSSLEEVRKRHLLERKAADDEIVKLRHERDRLVSITNQVQIIASIERKAADDEIVKLRNERDHLVSVINEVRRIASDVAEEPSTKKARIDGAGAEEFDSSFFDDAAAAWNQNKKRNGQQWIYKCIVPTCEKEGECDFDMCCYECFDKVCRNGSCKIKVTSKKKRGYCNECFETCGY